MNAALDVVIQSYVTPSAAVGEIDSLYTCLVIGRSVRCASPKFTLMWTAMSVPAAKTSLVVDHIVVLAR